MANKELSTYEQFIKTLSAKGKKEFEQGYKNLLLSELILALMEKDDVSIRKLAKMAGISSTVVQEMCSGTKKNFTLKSFLKILKKLGCKKLMVEINNELIQLNPKN